MGLLRGDKTDDRADEYEQTHEYKTIKWAPGGQLVGKLNEHAAAGWEVVEQLQSDGTTIRLVLRREL